MSFVVLGHLGGPLWACAAPGVAFTFNAFMNLHVVKRMEGVPVSRTLLPLLPPILSCVPMIGAVLAIRAGLARVGPLPRFAGLAAECIGGAVVFVASALVIAKSASRELLGLLRNRRRGPADGPGGEGDASEQPAA